MKNLKLFIFVITIVSGLLSCHKRNLDEEMDQYWKQEKADYESQRQRIEDEQNKESEKVHQETRDFLLEFWVTNKLKNFIPIFNHFAVNHRLRMLSVPAMYKELTLPIGDLGARKVGWTMILAEPTEDGRAVLTLKKNIGEPADGAAVQIEHWVTLETFGAVLEELYARARDYSEQNSTVPVYEKVRKSQLTGT
jgi:hypothetical protein